MRLFLKD